MLQVRENEISLRKWSGGTAQLPIWCGYVSQISDSFQPLYELLEHAMCWQ